jgi:TonB family protein
MIRFLVFLVSALCCLAEEPPRQKVKIGDKIYPAYQCFKEVKPLSVENPIYPSSAKNDGRGGEVLVGAVVNEKGKVTGTFVAKSTAGRDIQHAVRMAVAHWRFPKIKDRDAVISYVVFVPVTMRPQ